MAKIKFDKTQVRTTTLFKYNNYVYLASHSGKMVENSAQYLKVKGLNPAAITLTEKENMAKITFEKS